MFIIKDGVGYKIVDGKAYAIDFDENGVMTISKETTDFNEKDAKYTYSEMYHKLNVRYFSQLKKTAPKEKSFVKPNKPEKVEEKPKKTEE